VGGFDEVAQKTPKGSLVAQIMVTGYVLIPQGHGLPVIDQLKADRANLAETATYLCPGPVLGVRAKGAYLWGDIARFDWSFRNPLP